MMSYPVPHSQGSHIIAVISPSYKYADAAYLIDHQADAQLCMEIIWYLVFTAVMLSGFFVGIGHPSGIWWSP